MEFLKPETGLARTAAGTGRHDALFFLPAKILGVVCLLSFLLVVCRDVTAQEPSFHVQAGRNPDAAAQSAADLKKPRGKGIYVKKHGGSIGFFGSLVPQTWGELFDLHNDFQLFDYYEYYRWGVTGGIGVFGEYQILRFLTIGLELSVSFPRQEIVGTPGEDSRACLECRLGFLLQIFTTWKTPIELYRKKIVLYPAAYFGYAGYIARFDLSHRWVDRGRLSYHGIGYGWGIGLEYATWYNSFFLEVRWLVYQLWDHRVDYYVWSGRTEEFKEMLTCYGPSILVGLRFP